MKRIVYLFIMFATTLTAGPSFATDLTVTSTTHSNLFIPDVLGGDATAMDPNTNTPLLNQGLEYDDAILLTPPLFTSARRLAMDSIPNTLDWAIWDPSGRGDDHPDRMHPTLGAVLGAYHDGEQVEWISKFSEPADWGIDTADGLGADLSLNTGTDVPASSNTGWRATDSSGSLGLRLNGGNFTLNATIPTGVYDVHLIVRDNGNDSSGTATIDGVSEPIGSIADNGIHTLRINNDSGSDQNLNVVWGGGGQARFAGVVVQVVPEPSSLFLLLGGIALLSARRP